MSTLWTPADITTDVWLDADDSSTITESNGTVSEWRDKSGNSRHANQTSTSDSPIYDSINSEIVFDGNDWLNIDLSYLAGQDYCLSVVHSRSDDGRMYWLGNVSPSTNSTLALGYVDTDTYRLSQYGNSLDIDIPSYNVSNPPEMYNLSFDSTVGHSIRRYGDTIAENEEKTAIIAFVGATLGRYINYYYEGSIYEVIIHQKSYTEQVEGYLAWKWSLEDNLPTTHPYRYAPPYKDSAYFLQYIDQLYTIELDTILSFIIQNYAIINDHTVTLGQVWSLRTALSLVQMYSDTDTPLSKLVQYYKDAGLLKRVVVQEYSDAIKALATVDITYDINSDAMRVLAQVYSMTQDQLLVILKEQYTLYENDVHIRYMKQLYLLLSNTTRTYKDTSELYHNNKRIDFHNITIDSELSSYTMSCDFEVSQTIYHTINKLDDIFFIYNTEEFSFIVSNKYKVINSRGDAVYYISALSKAILLDTPYSKPLTETISANMASVIAKNLASYKDIDLEWNVVDWYITSDTLYANAETPIEVIKKILEAVGGVLQSKPDGTLVATKYYKQALSSSDFIPDSYLEANTNFFNISETPNERDGYNRYIVGNQSATSDVVSLEELTDLQEGSFHYLAGYNVPWTGASAEVTTSSSVVSSIEYIGVVEEELTESVEFVNGVSSVSKPIYNISSIDWDNNTSLGSITFSEDGTLNAEVTGGITDGCSLADITYTTKYYKWKVVSSVLDDVQFLMTISEV